MNVGHKIKQRREELNMSVDELAILINKNRATVYRYEKGEIENLPTNVLKPLAKALKTTPEFLMDWEDVPSVSHLGDHQANLKYFANKPELLELYKDLAENNNLRILFDSAKDLEPTDLEPVLVLIKDIRKEKGLE